MRNFCNTRKTSSGLSQVNFGYFEPLWGKKDSPVTSDFGRMPWMGVPECLLYRSLGDKFYPHVNHGSGFFTLVAPSCVIGVFSRVDRLFRNFFAMPLLLSRLDHLADGVCRLDRKPKIDPTHRILLSCFMSCCRETDVRCTISVLLPNGSANL